MGISPLSQSAGLLITHIDGYFLVCELFISDSARPEDQWRLKTPEEGVLSKTIDEY